MAQPTAPASAQLRQLTKGERSMFMTSDDTVMIKQIVATHAPDGREFSVKPILRLVEDILAYADPEKMMKVATTEKDRPQQDGFTALLEALAYVVNRLSCEISYKCMSAADGHATAVSLFNMVSSYSWDAKLVLTLAAFALNYGDFWLFVQISHTNPLARMMAILKQLPDFVEYSALLKPRFEALNNLVKSMLEVASCIVSFKELPSNYISQDVPALSTAVAAIPVAIYWVIRSVISCATNITYLSGMGHEYAISTTEAWELSALTHKIKTMNDHLQKQLVICQEHIQEKRHLEAYDALLHIFESVHVDNMKVLKALIYPKEDLLPIVDCSTKTRVALDVLRRKNVLLLISGLDVSNDELAILEQIYMESRRHASRSESSYEIVWIPVVDLSAQWTEVHQKQFEMLQANITWYSVHHPRLMDRAAIRFIKEKLQFRNKAILVVLDPQGKIVSPNALHMMWIWGSMAFPFTSSREEALWKEESWRLELLIDGIDPMVLDWISRGKHIIVCGGEDVEWIRSMTYAARSAERDAGIQLEIIYAGKSSKKEQVRRAIASITSENLCHTWSDYTMIWFFWTRLESMLFSKLQLGATDERDPILQEIKKLLSYDKSGGWAVYSSGPNVTVNGFGTTILSALKEYDLWKENAVHQGFDVSFKEHYDKLHAAYHPCCRFEFPATAGKTPETMKCPECLRVMEKLATFSCCHDDKYSSIY